MPLKTSELLSQDSGFLAGGEGNFAGELDETYLRYRDAAGIVVS
jgi:hypothetical protein